MTDAGGRGNAPGEGWTLLVEVPWSMSVTCLVVITMLIHFIMVVMNDYVGVCAGLMLLMTAPDALSSC